MAEPRPLRPATAPTTAIQEIKVCDLCGHEILAAHDARLTEPLERRVEALERALSELVAECPEQSHIQFMRASSECAVSNETMQGIWRYGAKLAAARTALASTPREGTEEPEGIRGPMSPTSSFQSRGRFRFMGKMPMQKLDLVDDEPADPPADQEQVRREVLASVADHLIRKYGADAEMGVGDLSILLRRLAADGGQK